jgi:hypothetical protein
VISSGPELSRDRKPGLWLADFRSTARQIETECGDVEVELAHAENMMRALESNLYLVLEGEDYEAARAQPPCQIMAR